MPNGPIVTGGVEKRPYDSRLFVERESDVAKIKQKIKEGQTGKISRPIVNFWGVQGIGKTWLLKYLHEQYQFDPARTKGPLERPTFTLFYTFDDVTGVDLPAFTRALARDIRQQFSEDFLSDGDYKTLLQLEGSGNTRELVSLLNRFSVKYLPIILLDDAEKIGDQIRDEFEQQFIEPLAVNNRILIILAGRRYVPRWQRFEVRKRVTEYNDTQIQAFDKRAAGKQISLSDYNFPIEWIYPFTGGNPYLTDQVANRMATWVADKPFDKSPVEQHQSDLISLLEAYEVNLLKEISKELLPIFYAVVALRTFRLEALRFMLGPDEEQEARPISYYVGLLHELDRETEVIWWSHEARAYVIDATVRRVISRREMLESPADYIGRHRRALAMYRQWAEKFPEVSEDFIKEIFFHLGSIYQADGDYERLAADLQDIIQLALTNLRPDGLFVLRNLCDESKGDREIMDLLPEEMCEKIYRQLAPL